MSSSVVYRYEITRVHRPTADTMLLFSDQNCPDCGVGGNTTRAELKRGITDPGFFDTFEGGPVRMRWNGEILKGIYAGRNRVYPV